MADRFIAIAVGFDQKRGVVRFVVVGARPRRAIVTPACRQTGRVESIDGPAVGRTKAPVPAVGGNWLAGGTDGDVRVAVVVRPIAQTVAEDIRVPANAWVSERRKDRIVERRGSRQIGNGYGNVIEHGLERSQDIATGGNSPHLLDQY